jgi:hypothetical protein
MIAEYYIVMFVPKYKLRPSSPLIYEAIVLVHSLARLISKDISFGSLEKIRVTPQYAIVVFEWL